MFSFWNRKGNKSPSAGKSSNILPQSVDSSQNVENKPTIPKHSYPTNLPPPEDIPPPPAPQAAEPEPYVAAAPNPHDDAIAEVHAKLLQVEQLTSPTRSRASSVRVPTMDGPAAPNSPFTEKLYDPATGVERAIFDAIAPAADLKQLHDEVWTHLTRIRELQSEIARMHTHMEGMGDGIGLNHLDVDADIDVDSVPTQEEEEAAKRQKEFEKLPGRFKGRSDNIAAIMMKLDDLSQAVTSFHALQAPPLSFESTTGTRQNTHSDGQSPTIPVSARMRQGPQVGSRGISDQNLTAELLHDSPTSAHGAFPG
ncbi:hypothetical protein BU17DRAFT_92685 [Hysterangium stoloniferum]|nr:hypothetical protein BU17DRAFT_92685 [Hysterangium stoloniferum]